MKPTSNKTIQIEQALQELFTDLHHSGLFSDGKVISDAVLQQAPEVILEKYRGQKDDPDFDLLEFYHAHFENAPELDSGYQSDTSQPVEQHIEKLWDVLTRQPTEPQKHSTRIPLPYPYIVPGGRFNEVYYWDSYFTMLGLQVSGRTDMIEHMLDNFAWLIDQYGFIPNGNRTYFLGRSQPPFFALMVSLLAKEKGDTIFQKYLPALEKEYAFWMHGKSEMKNNAVYRVVEYAPGKILNRYFDNINEPRTEMYADDIELIEKDGDRAKQLILDIKAACESGWDFSSRWFHTPDKMETIHTTDILSVEVGEQFLQCLFNLDGLV